jgi:hypothetical protein
LNRVFCCRLMQSTQQSNGHVSTAATEHRSNYETIQQRLNSQIDTLWHAAFLLLLFASLKRVHIPYHHVLVYYISLLSIATTLVKPYLITQTYNALWREETNLYFKFLLLKSCKSKTIHRPSYYINLLNMSIVTIPFPIFTHLLYIQAPI